MSEEKFGPAGRHERQIILRQGVEIAPDIFFGRYETRGKLLVGDEVVELYNTYADYSAATSDDVKRRLVGLEHSMLNNKIKARILEVIPEVEEAHSLRGKPNLFVSNLVLKDFHYFEKLKEDKSYLIEKFLWPKTVNMLFSPPAQFKSLIAMHLAMSVVTGKGFLGLKTRKNPVLLCDKENNEQIIRERLLGLRKGQGIRRKKFPLFFLTRSGDLLDTEFIEQLTNAVQEKEIKLVIFDTLHRFADYEENKADDINRLYTRVFQPLIDDCNCSILFLHHTGKDGKYRGSSDLFGCIDTAYSVKRKAKTDNFDLICEKSRFGEIEKIYGAIDFGQDYIKLMRLDEKIVDTDKITKLKEITRRITDLFSIKGDRKRRADIYTEFEMWKEKGEFECSTKSIDRSLRWLVNNDYLEKQNRGEYTRKWEGEAYV